MSNAALSVRGLGKKYRIAHEREPYGRLTESVASLVRTPYDRLRGRLRQEDEIFWALRDVTFEVQHGEVLGIIGRNGAGKSTLLKIMSRITEPTEGDATIQGRVGSLLEVGTGFHPELTGRENIFMSGAVLGMQRREIARRFDEIVEFAGIEQFLDTPVKRYSSGMQVRLGFSVAAHMETDVLIVDEVLAVGDAEFQKRCLSAMGDISQRGRTVLFVSHNMAAVSALCDRAVVLENGSVALDGPVETVVQDYKDRVAGLATGANGDFAFGEDETKEAQVERVRLVKADGTVTQAHAQLQPFDVVIDFVVRQDQSTLIAACEVHASSGEYIFVTVDADWNNHHADEMADQFPRKAGEYQATIHMPAPLLNSGTYELVVYLARAGDDLDRQGGIYLEVVDTGSFASILYKRPRGGVVTIPVRWDVYPRLG